MQKETYEARGMTQGEIALATIPRLTGTYSGTGRR
jgi:hypothetical protein